MVLPWIGIFYFVFGAISCDSPSHVQGRLDRTSEKSLRYLTHCTGLIFSATSPLSYEMNVMHSIDKICSMRLWGPQAEIEAILAANGITVSPLGYPLTPDTTIDSAIFEEYLDEDWNPRDLTEIKSYNSGGGKSYLEVACGKAPGGEYEMYLYACNAPLVDY